jgi:hypothetical protein
VGVMPSGMFWIPATHAPVISVPVDERLAKLPHRGDVQTLFTHASPPVHSGHWTVRVRPQLSGAVTVSHPLPCAVQKAALASRIHELPEELEELLDEDELLDEVPAPPAPSVPLEDELAPVLEDELDEDELLDDVPAPPAPPVPLEDELAPVLEDELLDEVPAPPAPPVPLEDEPAPVLDEPLGPGPVEHDTAARALSPTAAATLPRMTISRTSHA